MIYDVIGSWGITAKQFVGDLGGLNAERITVRINTPGGEVTEGTAIYNALREHPAEVVIQIDGIAASAGSFIAMSGDTVRMADNAYMMIHEASGGVMGEADDMRQVADVLDKMNDNIADMYHDKAGKGRKYWRNLMSKETWMTAAEAKAEGLVDEVYAAAKDKARAYITKAPFNFADFRNIPESVREMWGITNQNTAPDASPRGEEAAGSHSKEPSMATENNSPPAQTPVAVAEVGSGEETAKTIAGLRKMTNAAYIEQGRVAGIEEGRQQERERFAKIVAACPGKERMAIEAYQSGQTADSVKLAFDAEARADARANELVKQKDLRILQLEALALHGGTAGVSMAMALAGNDDDTPEMAPTAKAEWEWENNPAVRKTARSKEIYVLARAAELDGTHRSFSRQPIGV